MAPLSPTPLSLVPLSLVPQSLTPLSLVALVVVPSRTDVALLYTSTSAIPCQATSQTIWNVDW